MDNELVDHLAREYKPDYTWASYTVDNCTGIPLGDFYYLDDQFPMFANMPILLGSLGAVGQTDGSSFLPYTTEYKSVKFYRKINCDKDLQLIEYRTAGGMGYDASVAVQMPPTVDNQTPSVITGGTITAGNYFGIGLPYVFRRDDFDWDRTQYLNLYASQEIDLLPGFETDLLYQYAPAGETPWPSSITSDGPYSHPDWIPWDYFSADIVSCPMAKTESPPPSSQPVVVKPVASVADFAVGLYPNPATSQCTVRFSIPDGADVTITIIDMMGRDIATLDHSWHTQGTSSVSFNTESYSPGVYVVRFTDGTNASTQRLTINGK